MTEDGELRDERVDLAVAGRVDECFRRRALFLVLSTRNETNTFASISTCRTS